MMKGIFSMEEFMTQNKINLGEPIKQVEPGEAGYTPPVDIVPLPSRGMIYPVEHPLHCAESVEIRSMTAKEEDILTSTALLRQGKAITALLKSCLVNKSINPSSLTVGDRNAILIAIRITGYGSDYNISVECPNCHEQCKHSFNLAKLNVKPLGAEPIEPGQNAFSFNLPVMNKEVVFKLPTEQDETELGQIMEKTKKIGTESVVTTRLIYQIVRIGGETDRTKISQLIRNMPAKDSRKLRLYMDSISPGVEMVQEFTCQSCGKEAEVDVPLGTEFFWPSE
jgi:hypothetical protein